MPSPPLDRDLLDQALELYFDNDSVDDDTWAWLMKDPEATIKALLAAAHHLNDTKTMYQESHQEMSDIAARAAKRESVAQKQLAVAVESRAWVQDMTQKLTNVLEPLQAVAKHSQRCTIGTFCGGHEDMELLVRAVNDYMGGRD